MAEKTNAGEGRAAGGSPRNSPKSWYFGMRPSSIGLYRDVWIAAIASSRTSLATLTGVCVIRHNANYVRYA